MGQRSRESYNVGWDMSLSLKLFLDVVIKKNLFLRCPRILYHLFETSLSPHATGEGKSRNEFAE